MAIGVLRADIRLSVLTEVSMGDARLLLDTDQHSALDGRTMTTVDIRVFDPWLCAQLNGNVDSPDETDGWLASFDTETVTLSEGFIGATDRTFKSACMTLNDRCRRLL